MFRPHTKISHGSLPRFPLPRDGDAQCGFTDGATNATFDLSPLIGVVESVTTGSDAYVYEVSFCRNLAQSCGNQHAHASICQSEKHFSDQYPVMAWDNTPRWSLLHEGDSKGGVQVVTQNGSPPGCYPTGKPRLATIQFPCSHDAEGPLTLLSEYPCDTAPGYTFSYPTRHACPKESTCPYPPSSPCTVKDLVVVTNGGSYTIHLATDGGFCGRLEFSTSDPLPTDDCNTVFGVTSYYPRSMFDSILKELESSKHVMIYFWEELQSASLQCEIPFAN